MIHLIRASTRFCAYKDRRAVTAALKPIYTAPTVDATGEAMDDFEIEWGDRYPGIVRTWRAAWEQSTPFLRFPARDPQNRLYDEHGRVDQLPAPQSHQN